MISLPGLTLTTGGGQQAAGILRTFARYVDQGMLPNNFPDGAGEVPGYHTVDATLWYVLAVAAYERATGDSSLADELLSGLRPIVEWHVRGTRYGIGVDPADGPAAGRPARRAAHLDGRQGGRLGGHTTYRQAGRDPGALVQRPAQRRRTARRARRAGRQPLRRARRASPRELRRTVRARGPGLPARRGRRTHGDELALRPNQIFAVSLRYPLLEGARATSVVDAVGRVLLTGLGLRSLSPDDPAYRGDYSGDLARRDGSYHQGPVWTWLLGAYAEAHFRVHGERAAALDLLRPVGHRLRDACLGSVSEILEGDAPHLPVGCVAQAWGVAETLRAWRALADLEVSVP